jgi:alcohol dehydrogenase (cytochrome c)
MIGMRSGRLLVLGLAAAGGLAAQGQSQPPLGATDPGRKAFELRCGRCHGGDGKGGEMGPNIIERLGAFRSDAALTLLIHNGIPESGMPPNPVVAPELTSLLRFLHSITPRAGRGFVRPQPRVSVEATAGTKLDGVLLGEGFDDLQMRTGDGKVHLLRKSGGKYREVTSEVDWPEYNGDPRGNRYAAMTQITKENVSRLAPRWQFAYPPANFNSAPPTHLEATPVVVEGLMYVTDVNQVIALDAGSGRRCGASIVRRRPGCSTTRA